MWELFSIITTAAVLFHQSADVAAFTVAPASGTTRTNTKCTTSLPMALTPVGPFCPFRSKAALEMEPSMESLNTAAAPDFATEMARIQLDMQVGQVPEPERLRKVATGITSAVDNWESLLTRLRTSNDFQTREYGKLAEAHLSRHGQTPDQIAVMMRWQSECMIAMADNRPPPFPPSGMDVMKMMEDANAESNKKPPPSMGAMTAAAKITTTPFKGDESAFESETVREEYEALCRDHNSIIEMGHTYGVFDRMGKLAFLDQVEAVEDRWEIFFARFKLLGQLNEEFVRQCNGFLESMNLDEEEFREVLKEAHQLMRDEAERE